MKYSYLFIDFFSVVIPFLFSFHPAIKFHKDFKAFFAANFISAFCFIIWDILFTAKGIWGFNDEFIIGLKVFNLPIEEILFFVCIPFACVFTYKTLNSAFKKKWIGKSERYVSLFFIILFFVTGILFWKRTYTATTFISFSTLLFLVRIIFQVEWMGNLYRAWLILLFPFFIINGILTGTGLRSFVVWYNNTETLGIRILTIPVEDVVYGFELLLLTVFFYEMFLAVSKTITKVQDKVTFSIRIR